MSNLVPWADAHGYGMSPLRGWISHMQESSVKVDLLVKHKPDDL